MWGSTMLGMWESMLGNHAYSDPILCHANTTIRQGLGHNPLQCHFFPIFWTVQEILLPQLYNSKWNAHEN